MKHIFFYIHTNPDIKSLRKGLVRKYYDVDIIILNSSVRDITRHLQTLDYLFYDQDLCISFISDRYEPFLDDANILATNFERKSRHVCKKGFVLFLEQKPYRKDIQNHGFCIFNRVHKKPFYMQCFSPKEKFTLNHVPLHDNEIIPFIIKLLDKL